MLEKDLENATEAGLELERMLREVLSSNNEVNPLAQSVEDLQARLDAQQAANESLTNALNLKAQEVRAQFVHNIYVNQFFGISFEETFFFISIMYMTNLLQIETLLADLASVKKKCEKLEVEYFQTQDELTTQENLKNNIEQTLTDKIHSLKEQVDQVSS